MERENMEFLTALGVGGVQQRHRSLVIGISDDEGKPALRRGAFSRYDQGRRNDT